MPNGIPAAGTSGGISIGGVFLNLRKWSVNLTARDVDTSNFEGVVIGEPGYEQGVQTLKSAEVTIEGYWDEAINPHSNPPNLTPGDGPLFVGGTPCVGPVLLYVDFEADLFYDFPAMRVISVPVNDEVDGVVTISATLKSQGIYYVPGGEPA